MGYYIFSVFIQVPAYLYERSKCVLIKTHGCVLCCQEKCTTQVCYLCKSLFCQFQPSISQKLFNWFLPNLYILCPTYVYVNSHTKSHARSHTYMNVTSHTKFERDSVKIYFLKNQFSLYFSSSHQIKNSLLELRFFSPVGGIRAYICCHKIWSNSKQVWVSYAG